MPDAAPSKPYSPPLSTRAMQEGGVVTTLTGTSAKPQGFGFGFYGPGNPLPPIIQGSPLRQWDFAPGVNTTQTPRHTEPFSFAHLRAFANVELVRMAIETRKDQLEPLDWQIKPRDNKARNGEDARIKAITAFFEKPDGITPFGSFMRAVEEDLLALDAPCLECVRTRGGKLLGLEFVDGATINLLVDENGRRPRGPDHPAYQQIIRGLVWANLNNRDLVYAPRNIRTNHLYGFGAVEQIIVTINTILRRQSSQLAYFTEGNVPAGILNAPEGWTNEQIRDLQDWFDQRIAGNQAEQRKLIWVPKDSKYTAFKEAPIKDEFDEWLARLVAFAFSLPPTPFVRQMNKGTAGEDQSRALEEGLEPLKIWRKRLIDGIIASEFGAPDLEFAFREDETLDPKIQSDIDDKAVRNGSLLIDELRDRQGLDPYPNGMGSRPMIYLGDTPIPLDAIQGLIEAKLAPPPAPVMPDAESGNAPGGKAGNDNLASVAAKPKPGGKGQDIGKAARVPPANALALSIDRPKALRARAALARAIKPILAKAAHDVAAQTERKLEKADRDPGDLAAILANSIDLKMLLGLLDPLEAELEAIGLDAGALALASIGVDAPSELVDRVNARAVAYAKERAGELVSDGGNPSLIDSTREMVRRAIADGLERNIGRDAIADAIQESGAFGEARADLIADTEIAFANGAAKNAAWQEIRADGAVMFKQWFASGDEGVCPECEANDAQGEIGFDEAFDSGDDMEPAHPGCRCVTVARVVEDGAGGDPSSEEE